MASRRERPGLTVAVKGHLSGERGGRLLDSLATRPWCAATDVVLDLSGLTGIDRAGADSILDVYVSTTLRTGTLLLVGVSDTIRAALCDAGGRRVMYALEGAARLRGLRLVRGNRPGRF